MTHIQHGWTLRPKNEIAIKAGPFRVYESLTSARRGRGALKGWFGASFEIWTCVARKEEGSLCTYVELLEFVE